jgi:hypothetical protein
MQAVSRAFPVIARHFLGFVFTLSENLTLRC